MPMAAVMRRSGPGRAVYKTLSKTTNQMSLSSY